MLEVTGLKVEARVGQNQRAGLPKALLSEIGQRHTVLVPTPWKESG